MTEKILVTGGAGYIGCHVCRQLENNGYEPLILDPKSSLKPHVIAGFQYQSMDIDPTGVYEQRILFDLIKRSNIKTVIHLAGSIEVGESVTDPELYYHNNVVKFINFLNHARYAGVENIVVASSAAVYGVPKVKFLKPTTPCLPINPYGRSKLMIEQILQDYNKAYGFNSVALRIFNVCGADPSGDFGEDHNPETHIIPRIFEAVSLNKQFTINGTTYDTPDHTAIRDYIHVNDVANAFVQSVEFLKKLKKDRVLDHRVFNVGSGKGTSILSIIQEIQKQISCNVNVRYGSVRVGDPPSLVANIDDTKEYLGWQPMYSKLPNIITDAWKWHQK